MFVEQNPNFQSEIVASVMSMLNAMSPVIDPTSATAIQPESASSLP
jgi:hypothetical protein